MNSKIEMTAPSVRTKSVKLLLISFGAGAGGYLIGKYLAKGAGFNLALPDISASAVVALAIALIYGLMGLMVAIGVLAPKAGAKFLNVADEQELVDDRKHLLSSAGSMLVFGVALAIIAMTGPAGPIDNQIALAVVVVLIIAGGLLYWRAINSIDELMQQVSFEATSIAYLLMFVVGGGWAMLGQMEFMEAPKALDWLSMFWAFGLIGSFLASGKRGMLSQ